MYYTDLSHLRLRCVAFFKCMICMLAIVSQKFSGVNRLLPRFTKAYTEIYWNTRLLHFVPTAGFGPLINPFQLTRDFSNWGYLLSSYEFFFPPTYQKTFLDPTPSTLSAYWYRYEKNGFKNETNELGSLTLPWLTGGAYNFTTRTESASGKIHINVAWTYCERG